MGRWTGAVRQDRGVSRESGSNQYPDGPRDDNLIKKQKKNRTTGETRKKIHGKQKKAEADAKKAELEKQEAEKRAKELADAIRKEEQRRKLSITTSSQQQPSGA